MTVATARVPTTVGRRISTAVGRRISICVRLSSCVLCLSFYLVNLVVLCSCVYYSCTIVYYYSEYSGLSSYF